MPNDQWFLTAMRKELGITQEQLARAFNLRQIDVSNLERGRLKPTQQQLASIVRLLSARAAGRAFEHVILSAWSHDGE